MKRTNRIFSQSIGIVAAGLVLAMLQLPSIASGETIGSWPGYQRTAPSKVEVVDNRAYVLEGAEVGIFNVSNPVTPVRLGGYKTSGYASTIKAAGNFGYVGVGQSAKVVVLDLSNPANPVPVGEAATSDVPLSIDVAGNYAFIAEGAAGLEIWDLSNPSQPAKVSAYATGGYTHRVQAVGNVAYVGDMAYGLTILNVSDPAHPVKMTVVSRSGGLADFQVVGDSLYLAGGYSGWDILDVSDPALPTSVTTNVVGFGYVSTIRVSGTYAYTLDGPYLRVFNLSNPSAPLYWGTFYTANYSSSLSVAGNHAYVTDGREVLVLSVVNPANPTLVSRFAAAASSRAVELAGQYAYVADGESGLRIVDVGDPTHPASIGGLPTYSLAVDVAIGGHYAYVAAGGLQIVDVANPANPTLVGSYNGGNVVRVQALGDLIYAVNNGAFVIINVSNPALPQQVYYSGAGVIASHVAGNYAYVATGNVTNLNILNISNPANPVLVGGYGVGYYIPDLQVVGSYAYLAMQRWTGSNYFTGLEILDVSQPASPVRIGSLDTGIVASRLHVTNNLVYLANGNQGVLVVNVSDPTHPVCAGGFDTDGEASDIAVAGNYAYVADGSYGLLIASTPTNGFPFIVNQPYDQFALAGGNVVFGVSAQCGPLEYQWRFNETDLSGETRQQLVLQNVSTNQTGPYSVVVRNSQGAVTSRVARLTVQLRAPIITDPPASYSLLAGDSVGFCANVLGGPPPSLQWQFENVDLPNQTNRCLYLSNLETNQSGNYTLVASNIVGTTTSLPFHVDVRHEAPTILNIGPTNQTLLAGLNVSVCAQVIGGPKPTLHWQFEGVDLPDQTNTCLSIFGVQTNQSGNYTFVASNIVQTTSVVVTVTVQQQKPQFDLSPVSQSAIEGLDVNLIGHAVAGPLPEYYLLFNNTNIPALYVNSPWYNYPFTPAARFSLLEVTTNDAGSYRIVASNIVGMATSEVATVTITPAGPLDRWTQRNPLPQSQPILALTHGNGLFVGVGDHGIIVTSTNAVDWVLQRRRVDVSLRGVTWGAGQFIAVGDSGVILGSPDGTNWTHRFTANPTTLFDVCFGNGTFVAVGYYPQTVFTSSDGVVWEQHAIGGDYYRVMTSVAYGNNTFVAVGNAIYTSPDGETWTFQGYPQDYLEHVSFINDLFMAVGGNGRISISGSGSIWVSRNSGTTRRLIDATYGNGKYVVVGTRGTILTSPTTVTWTTENSSTPDRLEAVTFADGQFVAAGENGTTMTSTNTTTWTKRNLGTTIDLDGMVIAQGTIVVVGKIGAILRSTNGVQFTQVDGSTTNDLHGVGWANGLFIAVGEQGEIVTSPDAIHWTHRESGSLSSLKAVTFGPGAGQWVAVGTQGAIVTSQDAVVWIPQTSSPIFDLNDVAWGNGAFVIVGDGFYNRNGSVFRSTDGISWSWTSGGGFDKNVRGITFAEGLFVAAGNDGLLMASTNGINWSFRSSGIFFNGQNLRDAHFSRGLWSVVGNDGIILTSTDTFIWTRRPSREIENLHQVDYLDGKLVTIGNRGTILQSARWAAEFEPPILAGGTAQIPFKGVLNQPYRFEASTNLATWTPLNTFTNTTERTNFEDPDATFHRGRFYRMTQP